VEARTTEKFTQTELSEGARLLLGYLSLPGGFKDRCVALRNGTHYIVPSPGFNWDCRVDIPRVKHPECLDELIANNCMTLGEHETRAWHDDYSPAAISLYNIAYTLTEEGKRKGVEILAQTHN
jgi:hypothetical protein